jgi:hypothetical protein
MPKEEFDSVIRDSLGHPIPEDELNLRTQEIEDVLELLRNSSVVVLTTDKNASGKSTFGRILRCKILTEPEGQQLSDCVFMRADQIEIAYHEPRRQDRFSGYDDLSYPDLVRFQGLIILDEVYPEYVPLALTMKKAKLLLIVQPNFLESPSDDIEEEFITWLKENNIPVYRLQPYFSKVRS